MSGCMCIWWIHTYKYFEAKYPFHILNKLFHIRCICTYTLDQRSPDPSHLMCTEFWLDIMSQCDSHTHTCFTITHHGANFVLSCKKQQLPNVIDPDLNGGHVFSISIGRVAVFFLFTLKNHLYGINSKSYNSIFHHFRTFFLKSQKLIWKKPLKQTNKPKKKQTKC